MNFLVQLDHTYLGDIGGNLEYTYQLEMCQPSIMSTDLSGKYCNRCQTLHKTFATAINTLYIHKTCTIDVPEQLQVACVTHYEESGKIRSFEFV